VEETTIELEYAREAPHYRDSDLLQGTRLRMPHGYVESLLLPIVKQRASLDSLFKKEALRPGLAADYERAMRQLGLGAPDAPTVAKSKPREEAVA
jgi:hypothetical protein